MSSLHLRRLGRCLVLIAATILLLDGLFQIASPPELVEAMAEVGFPPEAGPRIALLTLSCAVLLAIPATAPYGALLTTAFLGGAICTHFRIGEIGSPPQLICVAIGSAVWLGLALADPRLRPLVSRGGEKRGDALPAR
jgi:hypothetical protein